MARAGWQRIHALILLGIFLGSLVGSPGLDALVHHSEAGSHQTASAHVEDSGPCPEHLGHCALGLQITGPRMPAYPDSKVRSTHTLTPRVTPGGTDAAPTTDPTPYYQTRAPPRSV